jgi:hypothetical protein
MPKDEFDFEDPFELNGMAFLSHEDTTNAMAVTFIEEFMRMGYGHKQILALFQNPQYLGPHMAFETRGDPFIRDLIADVFARWGKVVTWPTETPNPLTPTLAPSEGARENQPSSHRKPAAADCTGGFRIPSPRSSLFPLPLGEGEGQREGASSEDSPVAHAQAIEPDNSLTDPMGAPIPTLNV